tara:strand:+ start:165 stop:890 length:726 start_codon:yes stop_codon:yes gene_type:complete
MTSPPPNTSVPTQSSPRGPTLRQFNVLKTPGYISFTLTNLLKFMSVLSPFFLTFFIIMSSVVNNSIVKGLLFLIGLVIITFINYLVKSILREKQSPEASPLCNILPFPFVRYGRGGQENTYGVLSSPVTSTTLLGFISSYLIYPMYINNNVNNPLLMFLVAILLSNAVIQYWEVCTSMGGIVLGGILGITFGMLYYGIIAGSGYKDLAYFNEIKSTAQGCNKPTNQKFKCVSYKRGQPIGI